MRQYSNTIFNVRIYTRFSGRKHPDKDIDTEENCDASPCSVSMCDQSVVDWVQCESCTKWFHLFCVDLDRVGDNWICELCV